jgi:protein-disulfide isomerase
VPRLNSIQSAYVDTGKIQYAFRHFPLEHIHPAARQVAQAAICAGEQEKFWEFHDQVFLRPRELALPVLKDHARAVNIELARFEACILHSKTSDRVTADISDARRLGLGATPAFIIGEHQPNGGVRVLRKIVGAQPFDVFKAALDELLYPSPARSSSAP